MGGAQKKTKLEQENVISFWLELTLHQSSSNKKAVF